MLTPFWTKNAAHEECLAKSGNEDCNETAQEVLLLTRSPVVLRVIGLGGWVPRFQKACLARDFMFLANQPSNFSAVWRSVSLTRDSRRK